MGDGAPAQRLLRLAAATRSRRRRAASAAAAPRTPACGPGRSGSSSATCSAVRRAVEIRAAPGNPAPPCRSVAVTGRTLRQVASGGRARRRACSARRLPDPGDVVGVDVEDAGRGIERRAAPFRAAVEAGEDDRLLADRERHELPVAAEGCGTARAPTACASGVRVVSMSSVSRCRAKGAGLSGKGCVVGRDLAIDGARRAPRDTRSGTAACRSRDRTGRARRAWSSAPRHRPACRRA